MSVKAGQAQATASRAQIARSHVAWKACEGIRAADQIGGYARVADGNSITLCDRLKRRV